MSGFGLLLVLVGSVPLAHASPPDPLWIAGIYDGDEVVVALVSASGVIGDTVLMPGSPADISAGTMWSHNTVLGATTPSSTFGIRAPPFRRGSRFRVAS